MMDGCSNHRERLRRLIIGDGRMPIDSYEAADRVLGALLSDEALDRASIAEDRAVCSDEECCPPNMPDDWDRMVMRAAIEAAIGD